MFRAFVSIFFCLHLQCRGMHFRGVSPWVLPLALQQQAVGPPGCLERGWTGLRQLALILVARRRQQARPQPREKTSHCPPLVVKPLTAVGAPSVFGSVTLSGVSGNVIALRALDGGGSGYGSQNG